MRQETKTLYFILFISEAHSFHDLSLIQWGARDPRRRLRRGGSQKPIYQSNPCARNKTGWVIFCVPVKPPCIALRICDADDHRTWRLSCHAEESESGERPRGPLRKGNSHVPRIANSARAGRSWGAPHADRSQGVAGSLARESVRDTATPRRSHAEAQIHP